MGDIVSAGVDDCQHNERAEPGRPRTACPAATRPSPEPASWSRFSNPSLSGIGLLFWVCAIAATGAHAEEVPDLGRLVHGHLEAHAQDKLGNVAGRVYEEPSRRNAPPRALEAVPVALVPWSDAQVAEMEGLKANARSSVQSYREVAAAIESLHRGYETAIRDAGGFDLVKHASSDKDGVFRFDRVPAGEWLLVARAEVGRDEIARPRHVPRHAAERFADNPRLHARTFVAYWWRHVHVGAGDTATIELTDRGVTLTAVLEDLRAPPGMPPPMLQNR